MNKRRVEFRENMSEVGSPRLFAAHPRSDLDQADRSRRSVRTQSPAKAEDMREDRARPISYRRIAQAGAARTGEINLQISEPPAILAKSYLSAWLENSHLARPA